VRREYLIWKEGRGEKSDSFSSESATESDDYRRVGVSEDTEKGTAIVRERNNDAKKKRYPLTVVRTLRP